MTLDENVSLAINVIAQNAAEERDTQKLCQLLLAINVLLDIVEKRASEIDGHNGRGAN